MPGIKRQNGSDILAYERKKKLQHKAAIQFP
jgi:hypothetical protein